MNRTACKTAPWWPRPRSRRGSGDGRMSRKRRTTRFDLFGLALLSAGSALLRCCRLLGLSTIAGVKIGKQPWVIFQSAGWVNFQSAPTHGALPADPEVSCKGVEPCVRAGSNISILTYMNIENSLPITALETPGGSLMKDSSDTHPNHLPDSSYGLFIDNQ